MKEVHKEENTYKRDQKKEVKNRKRLYEQYGHLIGIKTSELPEEHRSPSGGLRCFKMIFPRDEHNNKMRDAPKYRCKKSASKGSLYCRHHGGGNSRALTHGKRRNKTLEQYKNSYKGELGDLLVAFIEDPKIMDLKPELATMRLVLNTYIEKLTRPKPATNVRKLVRLVENVMNNEDLDDFDKWLSIKDIVDSQIDLTSGEAIDRIGRVVDNIGKIADRIHRIETRDDFMLTPDGLKIFLRAIIEIISQNIVDAAVLNKIKSNLLEVSINTGGDLSKYRDDSIDV